ncbi:MAG: Sensor histidine kinase RcsC [Syntrophus sp. SKADARSKE-3]|nr:Sensor histidine kinase RcsC [Syntrophus sp. SKADARSKE-3]
MALKIQDLIDIEQFQLLQDRLNEIYSFPSAIIDNEGKVLTATAWQEVCTKFHRQNPECEKACIKSDQYIAAHLHEANPAVSYLCPHGLIDNATPIIIDGVHYGNYFTGQFFLEPPDLNFFRDQAKRYGFDEAAYIEAVKKVPIWTKEQLNSYLFFIKGLIEVIAGIGLKNLKEIETRKRMEESEEKHRRLFETMSQGVVYYNANGEIISANPAATNILGLSHEELLGKTFTSPKWKLLREDGSELPAQEHPLMVALRMGKPVDNFIIGLSNPQKDVRHWLSITVIPLFRPGETKPFQVYSTFEDITDRKQAEMERQDMEKRLFQAQKMEAIGTMAGGIAHDFNNILGIIVGYTEMALTEDQKKEREQYLQEALKGADRAKEMIRQLLTFSRKGGHEKKPMDLKLLVKEAVKFLRASIPTTIEIQQRLTKESCNILADPTQIHQIIMNLCSNATHAMKRTGGILNIDLTIVEIAQGGLSIYHDLKPGHYVKLTVSDTGHGMDHDIQQCIFDPFFTTKSKEEGTGLGLSVVYGIVKSHNGIINVYSEPDRGATFNIYLPAIIHTEAMKMNTVKPITRGTERILFVDDEAALANLGTRMLTSLGYHVTGVTSSIEALNLFQTEPQCYDIVITDMTLPKMTGIVLSRKILKIRPDIPIILCSGSRESETEEKAKATGIRAYLTKPLTRKELSSVIREILDEHE